MLLGPFEAPSGLSPRDECLRSSQALEEIIRGQCPGITYPLYRR